MIKILELSKKTYSNEEKEKFKKVIKVIVNLSLKVHSKGVLSLEEDYPSLDSFLLRKGIELWVEGCQIEDLKFVIDNYITARDYFDDELLERLIIREGLLLLVDDENYGKLLFEKILSMLGENFLEDFEYSVFDEKAFLEKKPDHNYFYSVESSVFQDRIMSIVDSVGMEDVIMKVGYVNMALTLKNCSSKVYDHVKNLSSEFIGQQIENVMNYIGPCRLKDITDAQNLVLFASIKSCHSERT